jgi:hypothetical protein
VRGRARSDAPEAVAGRPQAPLLRRPRLRGRSVSPSLHRLLLKPRDLVGSSAGGGVPLPEFDRRVGSLPRLARALGRSLPGGREFRRARWSGQIVQGGCDLESSLGQVSPAAQFRGKRGVSVRSAGAAAAAGRRGLSGLGK